MEGEGIARCDGMVVFVPHTLTGERVRVMVKEVRSRFARAGVIKLISPSPHRVRPVCPIFFKCGSCDLQHMDYPSQLEAKRANVRSCLRKACGADIDVKPTVPSPSVFGYRNKIQVPIGYGADGKPAAGYFAEGTHRIVPFSDPSGAGAGCAMYGRDMQKLLDVFLRFAEESGLSCYDEKTRKGFLRHFVARRAGGAYCIVVVGNGSALPAFKKLIAAYRDLGIRFSLYFCANTAPTNVIMQGPLTLLCGEEKLRFEVLGIKAEAGPLSFLQINDGVRDLIYSAVADEVGKTPGAEVIDAYSGTGILTNAIAPSARSVTGIEIVPQAVADADALTALNGNTGNVVNICADCADALPGLVADTAARNAPSVVILDPPRKGCDRRVIDALLESSPDKVIYVSCNPATLARDISAMVGKYDVASVTPYDMFPQTKHVETLAVLKRHTVDRHFQFQRREA